MAVYQDDLVVNVMVHVEKALASFNRVANQAKAFERLEEAGVKTSRSMGLFKKNLDSDGLKVFNDQLEKSRKRTEELKNRFDMNVLSWTFGGMALQRLSLSMTRYLIPDMQKLELLNTRGAKQVMGVSAAFEFLRISLFETLTSVPLFGLFVEWLVKAAIWVSEFAQKHPIVVAMAAALAGIGAVLGTIALGIGLLGQFEHLGKLAAVSKFLSDIAKNAAFIKGLGAVTLGLGVISSVSELSKGKFDLYGALLSALQVGLGIGLLTGSAGTGIVFGVVTLSLLITAEAIMDPAGFGRNIADILNFVTKGVETLISAFDQLHARITTAYYNMIRGFLGQEKVPLPTIDFLDDTTIGFMERLGELRQSGELSKTMGSFLDSKKLEDGVFSVSKIVVLSDQVGDSWTVNGEKFVSASEKIMSSIGDGDEGSGIVGRFGSLNSQLLDNNVVFEDFTNKVTDASRNPFEIQVNVRYNEVNKPRNLPAFFGVGMSSAGSNSMGETR